MNFLGGRESKRSREPFMDCVVCARCLSGGSVRLLQPARKDVLSLRSLFWIGTGMPSSGVIGASLCLRVRVCAVHVIVVGG